jgi:transcription elongation factor SPT6
MHKAERRRQAKLKKAEKRKAELRKNFEPVQLIENFCTERDDEIRMKDAPERFFDWSTPYHGPTDDSEAFTDEEEEQAIWILNKIPEISQELLEVPMGVVDVNERVKIMEQRQNDIISSIVHALRYLHRDNLEPAFIKRYRADIVVSDAVRNNLYAIVDEDAAWARLTTKRTAVEELISKVASVASSFESKGTEETNILALRDQLQGAQEKLDEVAQQEREIQEEIGREEQNDDDDDDLFDDDEVSSCRVVVIAT